MAQAAPVTALWSEPSQLSSPVIIPQRRPKDRTRGFIRAYAPDLSRCGIDQRTFLQFIDNLNSSVAASGAVQAINLAGAAAGAVPASVFVGAPVIGLAVQVAAGVYTEVQARKGYGACSFLCLFLSFPSACFRCVWTRADMSTIHLSGAPAQSECLPHKDK